jgi:hypothetical protein
MFKILALSLTICGFSVITLLFLVSPSLIGSKKLESLTFQRLVTGVLGSLVALNLIGYWLGIHGVSVKLAFQLVGLILFGFIGFAGIREHWKSLSLALAFVTSAVSAGTYSLLPIISKLASNSALGAYSSQNLDQISYIAIANEFIKSGFQESQHIAPGGINSFALHGTPITPTILMTFIMSIFQITAWEAVLPTIIVAFGFATLGLVRLIDALFSNLTKKSLTLISILIMSTSLISYSYINYFLGQILAIGLSSIILANTIENALGIGKPKQRFLELFLATILAVFIYPVFLIPFLIYSSLLGILVSASKSLSRLKKYVFIQTLAVLIGLTTTVPYLFDAYRLLMYLLPIKAGYPIPVLNPPSMLLFIDQIGQTFEKNGLLVSWIIVFGIIVFALFARRNLFKDSLSGILILCSSIAIVIAVPIVRENSFSDYQSWKLLSFFIPVVLALAIPLLIPPKVNDISPTSFGAIVILIVFLGYTHNEKLEISTTYPTKSMQQVVDSSLLKDAKDLNVDLSPGWENMLMSVMLNGKRIYPIAQDLWQTQPSPKSCTLVSNADNRYVIDIKINDEYGIVYGTDKKC